MLLYLVRNGQTRADAGEISGGDDSVLTEMGWEQVKVLARRTRDESLGHFYAGPQPRSLQTLEAIRDEHQRPLFIHPVFCEQWETSAAGWPRWRLQEAFPWADLPEAVNDEEWWPAQAETEMELHVRAGRAIQLLKERHPEQEERVLLMSHGIFGGALLAAVLGLSPCRYGRFLFRNASVSLVEIWEEGARLHYLNDVSHLPPQLRR